MRDLLARDDQHAREAINLFVYRIARDAAALVGSLGGLDGFVFTAGIGEHAPEIRAAVCGRLRWLGACIDLDANIRGASWISAKTSAVEIRVIPTDEEAMILRHTVTFLKH
jgi:acetate kinase